MRSSQASRIFEGWARKGRTLYSKNDLRMLFDEAKETTLNAGINRLVAAGILERVAQGLYHYPPMEPSDEPPFLIERIANTLRRGEHCYLSLESALSAHGWISQIPMDLITVMTTGREGLFETPYGRIEFTHTERGPAEIMKGTRQAKDNPLRIALPEFAYEDLRRTNRNLYLVQVPEEDEHRLRPFARPSQYRAVEHELDGMPSL